MQGRLIKKIWHTNRKCFIYEFSILQTLNPEGDFEHTYFERDLITLELKRLSSVQVKELNCTGLKDKNGDLIYEGDILFGKLNHKYFVVEYKNLEWRLNCKRCFKDCKYRETLLLNRHKRIIKENIKSSWSNYIEIIGNIYENPELLEAQNE